MNAQVAPQYSGTITLGVPAEEYHRKELGVVSAGVLHRLDEQTPAHYRAWVDEPEVEETPDMRFGRAYHDRVLLPELFFAKYVGEPANAPAKPTDAMRNAAKPSASSIERVRFWDEWNAGNAGKIILSADQFALIEAMHRGLMLNPKAAELFGEGDSEVTMRWIDPATGLPCKARADLWNRAKRYMADLKSTLDAGARSFGRSVVRYGYDVTHAHYIEAARECGEPIEHYYIVAQEKRKPYLAAVYELNAAAEARGYEIRQRGMERIAECLASNTWPGYPADVQELELPGWAIAEEMEIGYVE